MNTVRIAFIGDSFVNGTGDPQGLGWAGRLCAAAGAAGHDVTYYNLGVRRETSRDIAGRWQAEVARRLLPEIDGRLVFAWGANDVALESGRPRVPPEESLAHTRAILCAAPPRPALMIGPPPGLEADYNARLHALAAGQQQVAQELGVPYLSVWEALAGNPVWSREIEQNDGAHPRAGGYDALARLVQDWSAWRAWWA